DQVRERQLRRLVRRRGEARELLARHDDRLGLAGGRRRRVRELGRGAGRRQRSLGERRHGDEQRRNRRRDSSPYRTPPRHPRAPGAPPPPPPRSRRLGALRAAAGALPLTPPVPSAAPMTLTSNRLPDTSTASSRSIGGSSSSVSAGFSGFGTANCLSHSLS